MKDSRELSQFLSVEDISKLLKVTPWTVLSYIRKGKLKAVKVGRKYLVTIEDYQTFVGKPDFHLS